MRVLIIGGGISGCALAWTLHKRNIDFVWMDDADPGAPSRVAAGIITPIVPKRFALTWQHDIVLPIAHSFYNSTSAIVDSIFYQPKTNILVAESTVQMNEWLLKTDNPLFASYIQSIHKPDSLPYLNAPCGAIEITQAAVIDTPAFIQASHTYFIDKLHIAATPISLTSDNLLNLKEEYKTDLVVLCTGWYPNNADVSALPFNPAKGETITIQLEEGAINSIVQKHVYIAPVNSTILKVGATYEWDNLDSTPTEKARQHLEAEAHTLLNVPFIVKDHSAAVRPATHARRPLVGQYPGTSDVYVMNGMGTKGLLLAPWCAQQLANHVLDGTPIHKEIDVQLQRKR